METESYFSSFPSETNENPEEKSQKNDYSEPASFNNTSFPPNSNIYLDQKSLPLYHLSNYTFGSKEAQPEEDSTVAGRLQRLQDEYEKEGKIFIYFIF